MNIKPLSRLRFLSLPYELQVDVLMYMDYRSLLRCTSVCKSLNRIIKENSGTQCIIELGADGMNTTSRSLPHVDLLRQLRDRHKAWEELDLKKLTVVPAGNFIECRAYDLVAGTFSTSNGSDLLMISLPSTTHDSRALHHETIGLSIRDFAIDPTQDLIALFENDSIPSLAQTWTVRIHLRTVSSNKPHPLAHEGILSFDILPEVNPVMNATLQLSYDLLSLSINTGPRFDGALVWNWKTGCLLFDSRDVPTVMDNSQTFSLLNHETFMLTSIRGSGSLKIYTISHCERSSATLLATLYLPQLQPAYFLRTLDSHSGPVHAHPPENSLFTASSESRIQVISPFYIGPLGVLEHPSYSIFIHNDRLLNIARSTSVGSSLRWHLWGPQYTRFLPQCVPRNWLRYVHGQRVICPTQDIIQVLDFSRSIHPSSPGDSEMFLRSKPSRIPKESIFTKDVVTHLPYYAVNRATTQRFFAYMIDQDRIIGLHVDPLDEHLELHLFAL